MPIGLCNGLFLPQRYISIVMEIVGDRLKQTPNARGCYIQAKGANVKG